MKRPEIKIKLTDDQRKFLQNFWNCHGKEGRAIFIKVEEDPLGWIANLTGTMALQESVSEIYKTMLWDKERWRVDFEEPLGQHQESDTQES